MKIEYGAVEITIEFSLKELGLLCQHISTNYITIIGQIKRLMILYDIEAFCISHPRFEPFYQELNGLHQCQES